MLRLGDEGSILYDVMYQLKSEVQVGFKLILEKKNSMSWP